MNIAAFDLSLTATGFATPQYSGVLDPFNRKGLDRLRFIRGRVLELAADAGLVVIEGYSFGAKGNAILNLAELGGVIRVALADRDQPYIEIPPASLKLFATGKGNAPKDEVLASAIRRLGYSGHDHNEADALWLLRLTECGVGIRTPENDHQRRALAKIKWPSLAGFDTAGV